MSVKVSKLDLNVPVSLRFLDILSMKWFLIYVLVEGYFGFLDTVGEVHILILI